MPEVKDSGSIVVKKRTLRQQGGSLVFSIPREWVDKHGLKEGDEVGLVGNSILKVIPVKEIA